MTSVAMPKQAEDKLPDIAVEIRHSPNGDETSSLFVSARAPVQEVRVILVCLKEVEPSRFCCHPFASHNGTYKKIEAKAKRTTSLSPCNESYSHIGIYAVEGDNEDGSHFFHRVFPQELSFDENGEARLKAQALPNLPKTFPLLPERGLCSRAWCCAKNLFRTCEPTL